MKKKILVIEDNEQNIYLCTFILKKAGYEVFQARDGQSGLDQAQQIIPDLILLDIQLPVMDGFEVARRLRLNTSLSKMPIVAVTSYAMVGDKKRTLMAGCDGYIEKPINPQTFAGEIAGYLATGVCDDRSQPS